MIDQADFLRDKVILAFLADTGCRASELLRIKVENLDLESQVVLIPHLKRGIKKKCPDCGQSCGRSQPYCSKCGCELSYIVAEGIEERNRLINIGAKTCELLREYVEDLKPTNNLIGLTRQRVWQVVRDAGTSIGLKGKVLLNPETGKKHGVHPHSFRDSLAVAWLTYAGTDAGKQKALQDHLGHKSFATTMRYHKLTPAAVKKVSEEVRKQRQFG